MRACRVHILRAGSCRHPQAMTRAGAPWTSVDFPALVALILHPEAGPILFDTGYDPAFFAATQPFPERLYRWTTPVDFQPGDAIADQLARFGVQPEDVTAVIISHFHGDHVAGLHRFPQAAIHCARAGAEQLTQGNRLSRVRQGLLSTLAPADLAERAHWFEDRPRIALPADLKPFESGADLLGDGSLIAVPLPGHCPGHWGLLVRQSDDRLRFLIGDAAWSSGAVRDDAPPPRLTTGLLGDTTACRRTLHDLHTLWRRNPEIAVTPSHCSEVAVETGDA